MALLINIVIVLGPVWKVCKMHRDWILVHVKATIACTTEIYFAWYKLPSLGWGQQHCRTRLWFGKESICRWALKDMPSKSMPSFSNTTKTKQTNFQLNDYFIDLNSTEHDMATWHGSEERLWYLFRIYSLFFCELWFHTKRQMWGSFENKKTSVWK